MSNRRTPCSAFFVISVVTAMTVVAATSCKADNPAFDPNQLPPNVVCVEGTETRQLVSSVENPSQLDILFVVSNDGGENQIQNRLADAMPTLVGALEEFGIDYQIGVTSGDTSDPASSGSLIAMTGGGGCNDTVRIVTADHPDPARAAACNVRLGTGGSPVQELMEAATDALTVRINQPPESGGNSGFLRSRARLLVVFVGNQDDCSYEQADLAREVPPQTACAWARDELTPVASVAQTLLGLKSTDGGVSIAVFGGPDDGRNLNPPENDEPTCYDHNQRPAFAARRLSELASIVHPYSHFESACSRSFSASMARITDALVQPGPVTICPQARLAAPPLAVRQVGNGESIDLEPGSEGYIYLGQTDACDNGAILISPAALRLGPPGLEIDFCGL